MEKNNKKTSEKSLRKIIVSTVLLLSLMSITVSAWFVQNVTTGLGGDSAKIKAASISAELTGAEIKYGIPGESQEIEFTITDEGSTRAFAYRIEFDADSVIFDEDENYELGKGIYEDEKDEKTTIYGIINPHESSEPHIVTGKLSVEFFGENVVKDYEYDGNETQELKFNSDSVNFTYCQATPAAIADVFGLDVDDEIITDLMEEVNK